MHEKTETQIVELAKSDPPKADAEFEARLGILLRYWVVFRWLYMPAWVAFVLWFLLQLLGVYLQLAELSNVSGLAHLGGVGVGLAAWLLWRERWRTRWVPGAKRSGAPENKDLGLRCAQPPATPVRRLDRLQVVRMRDSEACCPITDAPRASAH